MRLNTSCFRHSDPSRLQLRLTAGLPWSLYRNQNDRDDSIYPLWLITEIRSISVSTATACDTCHNRKLTQTMNKYQCIFSGYLHSSLFHTEATQLCPSPTLQTRAPEGCNPNIPPEGDIVPDQDLEKEPSPYSLCPKPSIASGFGGFGPHRPKLKLIEGGRGREYNGLLHEKPQKSMSLRRPMIT